MGSVFMLYRPNPLGTRPPIYSVFMGGGSSSPSLPRVYATRALAERMRDRYFQYAKILEVEIPNG